MRACTVVLVLAALVAGSQVELNVGRLEEVMPGELVVCDGPSGPVLACEVPSGSFVLARVFALGTRPSKGPVQADAPWVKLGQDLHLATFYARDPGPVVTFSSAVSVTDWHALLLVVLNVGQEDPAYAAALRCSSSGDPVCGGAAGTPGKLKAPAMAAGEGALIVGTWLAHDEAQAVLLPPGYGQEYQASLTEGLWSSGYASGPASGPATATTKVPAFGRGIASRVVLESAA